MANDREPVQYAARDGIGCITLNRPAQLNAINGELLEGLQSTLMRAQADPDVGVILLCANGRSFCAGDDLQEFLSIATDEVVARIFVDRLQNISRLLMLGDTPVVCGAQGWIVGAAVPWLLNSDFVVVADDATAFSPEVGLGLFPSGGITLLLEERCGPLAANDFLWRGMSWSAGALIEHHIAGQSAQPSELSHSARAIAEDVLRIPATSRLRLRRASRRRLLERLELTLAYEAECCIAAALDPATKNSVLRNRSTDSGRTAREQE